MSHYHAISICYFLSTIVVVSFYRYQHHRAIWPETDRDMSRPGKSFLLLLLSVPLVLGIGQLYMLGWLLPETGPLYIVSIPVNQILIFSPLLLMIALRNEGWHSVFLPSGNRWGRAIFGLCVATMAVAVYAIARTEISVNQAFETVFLPGNMVHVAQVALEDIAIAGLFFRLRAWIGRVPAIGIIAGLFAIAHIPAMLASGVSVDDMASLIIDTAIGTVVLVGLDQTHDIIWVIPLHYVMDVLQFANP